MDQGRFLEMQQELEQLALVASVLLIVYNSAGEAISGLPGLMERLKKTIKILLAEMHTSYVCRLHYIVSLKPHTSVNKTIVLFSYRSFKADETFAAVAEKLCVELRGCLSQHGFSPFSSDKENTLKGQIVAAKSADNPIRKVIGKRVGTQKAIGFYLELKNSNLKLNFSFQTPESRRTFLASWGQAPTGVLSLEVWHPSAKS